MYTKCILVSFNKIKINNYELPKDFEKLQKNERKQLVLDNYKDFKYNISNQQQELIKTINDFRGINNIPLLGICQCKQIPDFVINESSELIIFSDQNIFKLSNKKYLFRYPNGLFEISFKNKDKDIISILSKYNLNHIQIITHQNIEYICIYELDFCRHHRTEFESDSSSSDHKMSLKLTSDDNFDSFTEYEHNYKNQYYYE